MADLPPRARPTLELLQRLREGKEALHEKRRSLSLREKVRAVLLLQRAHIVLLARQRPLKPWERPWDVEA